LAASIDAVLDDSQRRSGIETGVNVVQAITDALTTLT